MSRLERVLRESPWLAPLAELDPGSRTLAFALVVSVRLHRAVLSLRFAFPDPRHPPATQLEVVLVNSKTRSAPIKADVQAQANLDGGGNTDEKRRAKTPLPVLQHEERGHDLTQAKRKVEDLETRQRQLLSQLKTSDEVAVQDSKPEETHD